MQSATKPHVSFSSLTAPSEDAGGFTCFSVGIKPDTATISDLSMPKSQEPSKTIPEVSDEPSTGNSLDITKQSPKLQDLSLESLQGTTSGPSCVPSISKTIGPSTDMSEAKRKSVSDMSQVIPGENNPKDPGRGVQSDYSGGNETELCSIDVPSASLPGRNSTTPPELVPQRQPSLHSGDSSASVSLSQSVVSATRGRIADGPYSKIRFYRKTDKSGDCDSSMVYSPESSHTNSDSFTHKSFQSMEEKSKLVNISNNRGHIPIIPPMIPRKKGSCAGCGRVNFLIEKEYCMVCGIKYCGSCVLTMMGSMPEGRKCTACLGQPIAGSRRPYIGKPSKLLKHVVNPLEVQQIMKAEKECPANQLRPEQVVVNNRPLSYEELAVLLSCQLPLVVLKPGKYWYDGQIGLWGKEGHRPDKIITPSLKVGGNLQRNASNGKTQVFMNGRELGKLELKMLKFAGVNCVSDTHLWVEHDGSYSEEGFKNVKGNIWAKDGNLWKKAFIRLLYSFFSLPTPRSAKVSNSKRQSNYFLGSLNPLKIHKVLLLGHEGSGQSTIFKQAKILYNNGFTKEELASFKSLIQANIYKYMAILLEGRECFEQEGDDLINASAYNQPRDSSVASSDNNNPSLSQPDIAGFPGENDDKQKLRIWSTGDNLYRLEPSMKQLSDWFMQYVVCGNSEPIGNSSSTHVHDHISNIELLWHNTAIQATFHRRSELPFLPDAASFFLNRVAEFCRSDYEPSEIDILRTEGLSQGSGLVEIEITLDDDTGSWRDVNTCSGLDRYHVIRVGGKGMSDRHKWLDMFEDVRAVVFCVALSDYDLLWSDRFGNLSNKMIQTRDLFESILRRPCFQDTPFVLLLNKYDVFEGKIEQGVLLPTCTWFCDFRPVGASRHSAQSQAQQAYLYIAHKYKELFNSVNCTGRKLFTFQLNALDKTTVSGAFNYVKEILKWEEHKSAGWCIIPDDTSSYTIDISSFQGM